MKKAKRYNEEGYVTSDDSNAGMKEARDAIDADIAKTPSADYGDYMPESSSQTMVAAPKPKPKPHAASPFSQRFDKPSKTCCPSLEDLSTLSTFCEESRRTGEPRFRS